jgi:hypothetical protein
MLSWDQSNIAPASERAAGTGKGRRWIENRSVSGCPTPVRLPHTRIHCYISTRLWQLADRPNDGYGVQPTIAVSPQMEEFTGGRDAVMEAALRTLRRKLGRNRKG